MILHRTICGLNSSRDRKSLGDDLSAIGSICSKVDIRGDFANLHRVQCAGSALWTTPTGVKLIQDACNKYDFEQAIKIQTDLETKLKTQEQLIKQLREKVEMMAWHEELNLNVPQTQGEGTVKSTTLERTNVENGDGLDLGSVATANSKSTSRDQLSVD